MDNAALRLYALLRELSPLAIAFSGGLDSRFLAHCAAQAGLPVRLLHISGPHVPQAETRAARDWAALRGIPLAVLPVNPLSVPAVAAGDPLRCYHCKSFLFTTLKQYLTELPGGAAFTLCDGTNASDLGMHRPGLRALNELHIRSPLAESGFSKDIIRAEGARTGLENPMQTARPCLLTRFPYAMQPNERALAALDAAESAIAALFAQWLDDALVPDLPDFRLRMRDPDGPPFRAELHLHADLPQALREYLVRRIAELGFFPPVIRVMDSISGYHDRKR